MKNIRSNLKYNMKLKLAKWNIRSNSYKTNSNQLDNRHKTSNSKATIVHNRLSCNSKTTTNFKNKNYNKRRLNKNKNMKKNCNKL